MIYKTSVDSVAGNRAHADGKWLPCIGNKPVHVGDRVFTDGKVIFGNFFESQQPILFNRPPIEGIPIFYNRLALLYLDLNGNLKTLISNNDNPISDKHLFLINNSRFIDLITCNDNFIFWATEFKPLDAYIDNHSNLFSIPYFSSNYCWNHNVVLQSDDFSNAAVFLNGKLFFSFEESVQSIINSLSSDTNILDHPTEALQNGIFFKFAFIDDNDFHVWGAANSYRYTDLMECIRQNVPPFSTICQAVSTSAFHICNNSVSILEHYSQAFPLNTSFLHIDDYHDVFADSFPLPDNFYCSFTGKVHLTNFLYNSPYSNKEKIVECDIFNSHDKKILHLTLFNRLPYDLRIFPLKGNKFLVNLFMLDYKHEPKTAIVNSDGELISYLYFHNKPISAANFRFCPVNDISRFKRLFKKKLYEVNQQVL